MKLVIIEDSTPVRHSLKKLLAELEQIQIVGEAETLPAALELIENSKPEVIVLDLVLKDGSGFDVLKSVKNGAHPPLVIILTNYVSLPFRRKAQQEGADFFFDKSTEFEKVIEVLKQQHEKGKAGHVME